MLIVSLRAWVHVQSMSVPRTSRNSGGNPLPHRLGRPQTGASGTVRWKSIRWKRNTAPSYKSRGEAAANFHKSHKKPTLGYSAAARTRRKCTNYLTRLLYTRTPNSSFVVCKCLYFNCYINIITTLYNSLDLKYSCSHMFLMFAIPKC